MFIKIKKLEQLKKIKLIVQLLSLSFVLSLGIISCESENDNLGEQFLNEQSAKTILESHDLLSYHIDNKDSLRSDENKLEQALLGAFNEPVFGKQKTAYVSQIRLDADAPVFGTNPVIDSVVLEIKPYIHSDSVVTTTKDVTNTLANDATETTNTYPVVKYGKYKINGQMPSLKIRVHEVDEFLLSKEEIYYSNKIVNLAQELGSVTFDGKVKSIKVVTKSDNKEVKNLATAIRIPLDKTFFKNKIIMKEGQPELADVASFIRYFKGIRISVDENDGYMMIFNPNGLVLKMYYKKDVTANSVTTQESMVYNFNLGANNVHFAQINFDRSEATQFNAALANINTSLGDPKLYLQGAAGPGAEFVIPESTINLIKNKVKNEKIAIISAKIRLYTDETTWNNSYTKPREFVFYEKQTPRLFLDEFSAFSSNSAFQFIRTYDLNKNPAYYDISITQTLKNIVEGTKTNLPFQLNIGTFTTNLLTQQLLGTDFNTRAYTPNRMVLVGTDPNNARRVQLNITYTKK